MRRAPTAKHARPIAPPLAAGTMRVLLIAALALALAIPTYSAPAWAPAVCLDTDEIAGVRLEASGMHDRAPDIDAASAMLIGPDGRVLWSRDTASRRSVASITKVMTALVVLERSELDAVVTVSEAASQVPYALGLLPDERRTIRELLEYALVASSNDAAHALAEHVGGSVAEFAALMNERASRAGLGDTRLANPHGLDAEGHYSSATDVAALFAIAMGEPEYRRIVALPSITLPAHGERLAPKTVENTNRLLGEYSGVLGGKTGFTNQARYCLTASAESGGIALRAIVLGARSSDARFEELSHLLDWGFEHFASRTISTTTETVSAVPVRENPTHSVSVRFAETSSTPVFSFDGPIERTVTVHSAIALPVFEGQPLGDIVLAQGDRVLATIAAVAAEDVASAEETVGAVPVSDYLDRTVVARASGEPVDVPEFDPDSPVERDVRLDPHVAAPVSTGDRVGTITYSQNGAVIVEVPVIAAEEVAAPALPERAMIWLKRLLRRVSGQPTMAPPELAAH